MISPKQEAVHLIRPLEKLSCFRELAQTCYWIVLPERRRYYGIIDIEGIGTLYAGNLNKFSSGL
jgi:hypothetical protein